MKMTGVLVHCNFGNEFLTIQALKAESLAAKGQPIKFLAESDFMAIIAE